ncbi:hypothetical protein BACPEC_01523 [[Bacteroides] pectinophilus ATCC 43243]|uniref:Uncharacterized protein n=1 Tax=[Bacteroides] pectinophilus ATCC 43243 TaxID=483218 RepID=B7ATQ1_9FIRM|nr:hypothetical protein BACPEC_01523 [[Bacteroides] pectinophilus ATCC 43243]
MAHDYIESKYGDKYLMQSDKKNGSKRRYRMHMRQSVLLTYHLLRQMLRNLCQEISSGFISLSGRDLLQAG